MSTRVDVDKLRDDLDEMLVRVAAGDEIVLIRDGKAITKVAAAPQRPPVKRRGYGAGRGTGWFAPGWDDPDPEIDRIARD